MVLCLSQRPDDFLDARFVCVVTTSRESGPDLSPISVSSSTNRLGSSQGLGLTSLTGEVTERAICPSHAKQRWLPCVTRSPEVRPERWPGARGSRGRCFQQALQRTRLPRQAGDTEWRVLFPTTDFIIAWFPRPVFLFCLSPQFQSSFLPERSLLCLGSSSGLGRFPARTGSAIPFVCRLAWARAPSQVSFPAPALGPPARLHLFKRVPFRGETSCCRGRALRHGGLAYWPAAPSDNLEAISRGKR